MVDGRRRTIGDPPLVVPAEELFPQLESDALLDPEERHNRVDDAPDALSQLTSLLDSQREAKRLLPAHRNPVG